MSKHCENCGERMWQSGCPNCHEEKCIYETQWEYMDRPPSEEFMEKVVEQTRELERKIES